MSDHATDPWATAPPPPDPLAAEREMCQAETRAAREWLRTAEARRMARPDAERHVAERLPWARLTQEDWGRHRIVREAPRYDGAVSVTCPCGCAHEFEVGLRGDAL